MAVFVEVGVGGSVLGRIGHLTIPAAVAPSPGPGSGLPPRTNWSLGASLMSTPALSDRETARCRSSAELATWRVCRSARTVANAGQIGINRTGTNGYRPVRRAATATPWPSCVAAGRTADPREARQFRDGSSGIRATRRSCPPWRSNTSCHSRAGAAVKMSLDSHSQSIQASSSISSSS